MRGWRRLGIAAALCLGISLAFVTLFIGPGPKLVDWTRDVGGTDKAVRHPCDFAPSFDGHACQGSGAVLSVSGADVNGCGVVIGGRRLGTVPLYRASAPTGRCSIRIVCGEDPVYCEGRILRAALHERLQIGKKDLLSPP